MSVRQDIWGTPGIIGLILFVLWTIWVLAS